MAHSEGWTQQLAYAYNWGSCIERGLRLSFDKVNCATVKRKFTS